MRTWSFRQYRYIPSSFFTKPYESCENINDKPICKKEYFINGLSFYEEPFKDTDVIQEFEITKDKGKLEMKIRDRYSRVNDPSSDQDMEVVIRETPYGLIINHSMLVPANNWHSIISEQGGVRCMVCDVTVDKLEDHIKLKTHVDNLKKYDLYESNEFNENIMRKIGDNYQCVTCNVFFNVLNIEKHFESKEHSEQISYSKKSNALILEESTKLNDGEVKLEDDSWNMIVTRGKHEFYCLVCVSFGDISNKRKHYTNEEHLKKLNECTIVEKYKQYFVRQVNEKYYHCGVCNSLQHILYIDDHIRIIHNSKKSNTNQEKPQEKLNTGNQINANIETRNLVNENINHESNENLMRMNQCTSASSTLAELYIQIHVYQLQYKLRVSFISYNYIGQVKNDCYQCGVCDFLSSELYMKRHIKKRTHMEKIAKTPFLIEFGENLIRLLGSLLGPLGHCALCNDVFDITRAYRHTLDPTHIRLLEAAIIKSPNHMNNEPKEQLQMKQITIKLSSMMQTKIVVNESSKNQMKIDVNGSSGNLTKVEERHNFQCIYLKFKNTYAKVSYKSYNALINIGDGSHFCFLCSLRVFGSFKEHMEDENHLIHLKNCHFIDKYDKHLLRQLGPLGHCALCNDVFDITRAYRHTLDPTHIRLLEAAIIKSPNHMNNEPKEQLQMKQITIKLSSMMQTKIVVNESSKNQMKIDVNGSSGNLTKVEERHNFQCIYLKFKNTYAKVSYKSYNALINIGDGSHFCFLCSLRVFGSFKEHMEDENHLIHLKNCHFIDKYDKHLLRQNSFAYHCCSCNIMFTKSQLSAHMTWQEIEIKSDKKTRKIDFKSGIKQINIKTTSIQESAVSHVESKITIIIRIDVIKAVGKIENDVFNGNALKISWDSWHGFSKIKKGFYCILCQRYLKSYEVNTHISKEKHTNVINKAFETKFFPSLIRKINGNKLHCLTCNVKVLDNSVFYHIKSKKHKNSLTIKHVDIKNLCGKDI